MVTPTLSVAVPPRLIVPGGKTCPPVGDGDRRRGAAVSGPAAPVSKICTRSLKVSATYSLLPETASVCGRLNCMFAGAGRPEPVTEVGEVGGQVHDPVVVGVGDPDASRRSRARCPAGDRVARPSSEYGRDPRAVQVQLLDPVVVGVGDEDVRGGDGDPLRVVELAVAASDPRRTPMKVAGVPRGRERLDPVVVGVGDVDVPVGDDVEVLDVVELPARACRSVPFRTVHALGPGCGSGRRANAGSGRRGCRRPRPCRPVPRRPPRATRTCRAAVPRAPPCADEGAGGVEVLDALVQPVHHVDVAVRGGRHAERLGERRARGRRELDLADRGAVGVQHLRCRCPRSRR